MKESEIWVECLEGSKDEIIKNAELYKTEIITRFISIPSLKPISNYHAKVKNI